jgi:hypothetical protein
VLFPAVRSCGLSIPGEVMPQQAVRRIQFALVVALVIASGPPNVMAEGGRIGARVDLEYLFSDIERKDHNTGDRTDSEFSRLKQKYDVDLQTELLPFLEFRAGGIFEFIDVSTTTDQADPQIPRKTSSDERTRWLFAELNLDNPLYTAGAAYRRRKFEFDPRFIPKIELSREEFAGLLSWRPVGLPLIDLDVESTRTWDEDDTVDRYVDRVVLKTRYDYHDISTDYTYTRNDTDEKIEDKGVLTQIHTVGAQYTTGFFDERLQLNSAARFNYQNQDPHGDKEIEKPTSPAGLGFFYTDDDKPDTLTPVSPGDPLTTINIGRNGPFNPVSVGLAFFGFPTEVNRVHILPLVDPDDPSLASPAEIASVANDYVWTVFWSDDQLNWIELNVTQAIYTAIDNRFEITFERVEAARFIKVVTDPQPDAPGEIRTFVIRAFTTLLVPPGTDVEDIDTTVNLGLRWAISDKTQASYETYFRYQNSKPFDFTKKTFTNSISLQHIFNPIFFANARVLRTDGTETLRKDTTHHSYSASLEADYFETLHQSLVYSGVHDKAQLGTSYTNSIFLRTNADIYEGWSSNLDLGFSAKSPIDEANINTTNVRVSTDVDPNPRLKFLADYRFAWNTQSGEPSWTDHNARFQGFWVPLRTLSFFAAVRLRYRERERQGLEVAQDYSVNWAPFPDGLLRFSVGYNRTVDTNSNTTSALSPQIDWQVTRTSLLTLRFNLGTVETDQDERDVKNFRLTFRTFY